MFRKADVTSKTESYNWAYVRLSREYSPQALLCGCPCCGYGYRGSSLFSLAASLPLLPTPPATYFTRRVEALAHFGHRRGLQLRASGGLLRRRVSRLQDPEPVRRLRGLAGQLRELGRRVDALPFPRRPLVEDHR